MSNNKRGDRVNLSSAELRALCEDAADRGVAKYIRALEGKKRRETDRMLHNTKLLLENYTKFKAYIAQAVQSLSDVEGMEDAAGNMEIMRIFGLREEDTRIQSVQRSVTTMTMLMAHVDRMLEVYKADCEGSTSPAVRRRWYVIERMYLQEKKMTSGQIAAELHLDPRGIREDARLARDDLKALLFGIEAIISGEDE